MVWAVSTDNNNGTASSSLLQLNSLIKKSLFGGQTPQVSSLSQCVWGDCDADCPAGTTPATTGKGKSASNVAIYTGCPSKQERKYCCPTDDVPTCHWVSFIPKDNMHKWTVLTLLQTGSAPLCVSHSCADDEVQVATDQSAGGHSCWFNHKSLCCSATSSDAAVGKCGKL